MRLLLIVLLSFWVSSTVAGDKNSQVEKAVTKEVQKELLDVNGKGKPNNPGAKGQANAAYKKATNPGQGAGKSKGVEASLFNELPGNDKKGDKKNKDKKDKDKKDKDKKKQK